MMLGLFTGVTHMYAACMEIPGSPVNIGYIC